VPRQITTGGRPKLVGITKRGSKYLRKMLIQGARAAVPTLKASDSKSAHGFAGCWPALTATPPWLRSSARWLASPGPC